MENKMENLPLILKERRKELGLTLLQIAEYMGVKESTVQRWESGNIKSIRYDKISKLANLLNVDPSSLMGWGDSSKQNDIPPGLSLPPKTYKVPRVGSIACGAPILAEEHIEDYDDVPESVHCDFTLICKGDSMVGAGIEDGDIVYIREQPEVENGEIAAIMVGTDEATIKRFKRIGDTILLMPENSKYEPFVFSGEEMNDLRIIGKVVGFTRIFDK